MTLDRQLLASAHRFKDRPAINVAGIRASYEELFGAALLVRDRLHAADIEPGQLVAVYGERTFATYSAILGILIAGCGYVPLNVTFPAVRNEQILRSSGAMVLLVDRTIAAEAIRQLGSASSGVPILDIDPSPVNRAARPDLAEVSPGNLADAAAYLLFTSGTTGVPKGVPITAGNLLSYLEAVHPLIPLERVIGCSRWRTSRSICQSTT